MRRVDGKAQRFLGCLLSRQAFIRLPLPMLVQPNQWFSSTDGQTFVASKGTYSLVLLVQSLTGKIRSPNVNRKQRADNHKVNFHLSLARVSVRIKYSVFEEQNRAADLPKRAAARKGRTCRPRSSVWSSGNGEGKGKLTVTLRWFFPKWEPVHLPGQRKTRSFEFTGSTEICWHFVIL